MRKHIMIFLFLFLVFLPVGAKAQSGQPEIYGEFGIAIDAKSGETLYEKNADQKAYPASLTKLMTAVLLEENVKDGEIITASANAAGQEASNFEFKLSVGEKISKENALNALLVISANDVAMAIAEHVANTQQEFAQMMNDKAKQIGASNTNFVTPNGLHDPNHYTTARDLALIAREALKYPAIVKALGTREIKIKTDKKEMIIKSPNKVNENPNAVGGKTGYTNAAQNNLMEVVQKDGKQAVAVVMKSSLSQEYPDVKAVGDYALENIDIQRLVQKNEKVGERVFDGQKYRALADKDIYATIKKGQKIVYERKIEWYKQNQTKIKKNQVVGVLKLTRDGILVGEAKLVSDADIEMKKRFNAGIVLIGIGVPIIGFAGVALRQKLSFKKEEIKG